MKIESKNTPMEFTGERFTPEIPREIWYEHYHRYALASTLVTGLDVLDAACGEGYGSAVLAASAKSVTAVDISTEAVQHAERRYSEVENLNFSVADCSRLEFATKKFDAIISFETLEHLEAQEAMLAGFRNLLKPGGFLLISSPDKAEYSDAENYENPWHVKELYRQELLELLHQQFPVVRLWGQKLGFHSIIWDLATPGCYQSQSMTSASLENADILQLKPTYFLALCAATEEAIPQLPALNLFADEEASVYQHYNHEIRKNMAAGKLLQQRDQQIDKLQTRVESLEAECKQSPDRSLFSRWFKTRL